MNIKQLITATLVVFATSAAFAQQAETNPVANGKTRAEVTAELQQAQTEGSVNGNSLLGLNNPVTAAAHSSNVITRGKTRAEVMAELQQAQYDGTAMPTSIVAFDRPAVGTSRGIASSAVAGK
jgi:hypothetical protein